MRFLSLLNSISVGLDLREFLVCRTGAPEVSYLASKMTQWMCWQIRMESFTLNSTYETKLTISYGVLLSCMVLHRRDPRLIFVANW
jgi:hypothetical protein